MGYMLIVRAGVMVSVVSLLMVYLMVNTIIGVGLTVVV